jgi:hypothetical protein
VQLTKGKAIVIPPNPKYEQLHISIHNQKGVETRKVRKRKGETRMEPTVNKILRTVEA